MSPFSGSAALPSDVYAAILAGLRTDRTAVAPIAAAAGGAGLPAAARAFLRAVSTGAKAYDPLAPAS